MNSNRRDERRPTQERVELEINSWLDDEQQLIELAHRCIAAMLGYRTFDVDFSTSETKVALRKLLASDWLDEIDR